MLINRKADLVGSGGTAQVSAYFIGETLTPEIFKFYCGIWGKQYFSQIPLELQITLSRDKHTEAYVVHETDWVYDWVTILRNY